MAGALVRRRSEVNSFEPNYEGSSIVGGRPAASLQRAGSHEFVARAGHHLAPRQLASGRNVFEELGSEFTLIDLGAPVAAIAEIGTPPKHSECRSNWSGRQRRSQRILPGGADPGPPRSVRRLGPPTAPSRMLPPLSVA